MLVLRGGRSKGNKEEAKLDVDNEKLALEYMSKIRNKGLSTSLDLNDPDEDKEEATIGVPQQVKDEQTESKRRSNIYPRSILWSTTRRTALCIQMGDEHWKKINTVRIQHDKSFDHWFMPAIKLTNVFFTPVKLYEASEMVQQCIREMAPFNITFTSLKTVQHASQACLWLEPDEESKGHLLHLREQLMLRFPTLVDRMQFGDDGTEPHVQLAQVDDMPRAHVYVTLYWHKVAGRTCRLSHRKCLLLLALVLSARSHSRPTACAP